MEPITDLICLIPMILEFVVWGILMIIFGIINFLGAGYVIGLIWTWPLFICTGIALIFHNLVSTMMYPLCAMFPFLYIMPNMCLSFLNNASIAGLLPILLLTTIGAIIAIIVAIPQAIAYPLLILGCNSNGVALFSKVSQTILSWICA